MNALHLQPRTGLLLLGKATPELMPTLRQLRPAARHWPLDAAHDLPVAVLRRLQHPAILVLLLSQNTETHWIQQALRQQPHSKIIACVSQPSQQLPCELIGLGVFDCLHLPADFSALPHAIHRARLFLDSEMQLQYQGQTRLQLTVQLHEGPREAAAAAEELLLRRSLAACQYNITNTARLLGLARSHLYYYLNKYGIQRPHQDTADDMPATPCRRGTVLPYTTPTQAEARQLS